MTKHHIVLTAKERGELEKYIYGKSGGKNSKKRAKVLLDLDESGGKRAYTIAAIQERCEVSEPTVYAVCKQYKVGGVKDVLSRKKRETPPVPAKVTGEVEARIIATCCSTPPEGFARWSARMIAEKIVVDGVVESICDETVRLVLKKRNLSHT